MSRETPLTADHEEQLRERVCELTRDRKPLHISIPANTKNDDDFRFMALIDSHEQLRLQLAAALETQAALTKERDEARLQNSKLLTALSHEKDERIIATAALDALRQETVEKDAKIRGLAQWAGINAALVRDGSTISAGWVLDEIAALLAPVATEESKR